MFKKIYQAVIMAQAVSAAMKMLHNSTDAQLAQAGINRATHPLKIMRQIEAEFAAKDAKVDAAIDTVADTNLFDQAA